MYGDPMAGLDAWLEAPYVDAANRADEFERWAEAHLPDLDWDDEQAVDAGMLAFERWCEDQEPDIPEPPDDWDVDPRDFD